MKREKISINKTRTKLLKNLDIYSSKTETISTKEWENIAKRNLKETVEQLKNLKYEILRERKYIKKLMKLAEKIMIESNGINQEFKELFIAGINEEKEDIKKRK